MNPPAPLSLLESRILGVLVEKEKTVPDTYPLSLNALTAGCNQKNNRDPVLSASDSEVLTAIDELKVANWVIESSGARVTRYSHNIGRVLRIPEQSVALLAALMLRGQQTAAELRAATDAAVARGLFGVPTVELGPRLFWGLDALPMVAAALRGDAWFDGPAWAREGAPRPGIVRG